MSHPVNLSHPALALPNHVAYKATREEVAALYRRNAVVTPIAAAPRPHVIPLAPPPPPPPPRVLTKTEKAAAATAYSKKNGVTFIQAFKILGFSMW